MHAICCSTISVKPKMIIIVNLLLQEVKKNCNWLHGKAWNLLDFVSFLGPFNFREIFYYYVVYIYT